MWKPEAIQQPTTNSQQPAGARSHRKQLSLQSRKAKGAKKSQSLEPSQEEPEARANAKMARNAQPEARANIQVALAKCLSLPTLATLATTQNPFKGESPRVNG